MSLDPQNAPRPMSTGWTVSAGFEGNYQIMARPFVKMAGGKTRLIPALLARMPKTFGNYFEPFVGGGALFFHLRFWSCKVGREFTIGDTNDHLIETYRAVRSSCNDLVRRLRGMPNSETFFKRVRALDMNEIPGLAPGLQAAIAARYIYLNKTCFNGLHRVNRSGQFNTPFGRYHNPTICDEDNLRACSRALRGVTIGCRSFIETVSTAKAGDLVYFDPPYLPLSKTSNFTAYNAMGFGYSQHADLAACAFDLKKRGVHVMISNSNEPRIRELYKHFDVREVMAARAINASGDGRGKIKELIIT